MSGYFLVTPPAPVNANLTYEPYTLNSAGVGKGTQLPQGASHAKGAWVQLGVASADLSGLIVSVGVPSVSNLRTLLDISIDGGVTTIVRDLFTWLNGNWQSIRLPIRVPAGATISARGQTTSNTQTFQCMVEGVLATSTSAPGYSSMTALGVDLSNTRAASPNIPLTDTWTQIVAATPSAYGAVMAVLTDTGTAPVTPQQARISLGVGAPPSEFFRHQASVYTTGAIAPHSITPLIETPIAQGQPISARIAAATPGSDALRAILYGLA